MVSFVGSTSALSMVALPMLKVRFQLASNMRYLIVQPYLLSDAVSRRNFFIACNCWDMEEIRLAMGVDIVVQHRGRS